MSGRCWSMKWFIRDFEFRVENSHLHKQKNILNFVWGGGGGREVGGSDALISYYRSHIQIVNIINIHSCIAMFSLNILYTRRGSNPSLLFVRQMR
jgi:hypothetical protein